MWDPCALYGKTRNIVGQRTVSVVCVVSSVNARKMHHCSTFRDTATVDQILIEGDIMYFNALESQNIPATETMSLIYLSNQAVVVVETLLRMSSAT